MENTDKKIVFHLAPTSNMIKSDATSDVISRSELNIILQPPIVAQCVPVLERGVSTEHSKVVVAANQKWITLNPAGSVTDLNASQTTDLESDSNGLCDRPDYPNIGFRDHFNHISCIESDNSGQHTSKEGHTAMESKHNDIRSHHGNGSKVTHLRTHFNGSKPELQMSTKDKPRTITVLNSTKPHCDKNENVISGTSMLSCVTHDPTNSTHIDGLNSSNHDVNENTLRKDTFSESTKRVCDIGDTMEVLGDFNRILSHYSSLDTSQSNRMNPVFQKALTDTNGLNNNDLTKGLRPFDGLNSFQRKDISANTSHNSTVNKYSAASNHMKVPGCNSSSAKHISSLREATTMKSSGVINKCDKYNSTRSASTLNVLEDKFKKFSSNKTEKYLDDSRNGMKVSSEYDKLKKFGPAGAEKVFDESRNRLKVSSEPDKSLAKVVEELNAEDEAPQPDSFVVHEQWLNSLSAILPTLDDSDMYSSNTANATKVGDKSISDVADDYYSHEDEINNLSGISIVIDNADGNGDDDDDDDSASSDSEVDFELRAQLLAQINPLLLAPGFSEGYLGNESTESDSDDNETSSTGTGSTIVSTSLRNDLERVKGLAERLKLNTKRPSFVAWKEQIIDKPYLWRHRVAHQVVNKGINDDWSSERLNRITEALAWLRSELMDMRVQDQVIARQLVALRKEIHRVKLEKLTAEHQDMIEDACEMESEKHDELAELDDAPPDMFSPRLKHFGVTPMNISTRRFSVF